MTRGFKRFDFSALGSRLNGRFPARDSRAFAYAPEILLGLLIAVQAVRVGLAVAGEGAPDYRQLARPPAIADRSLLGSFDGFFRAADGPMTVSTLDLVLYGTRVDPVMGRGSAIIGGPGGEQASYFVGEEVRPGVVLQSVDLDHVTLARGGVPEQLILNQSTGGETPPPQPATPAVETQPAAGIDPTALVAETGLTPRINHGAISGYTLQPQGDGAQFKRAGLQAGDVLVSVNGMRMTSPQSVAAMVERLGQSSEAVLEVERGGKLVTVTMGVEK